MAKEQRKLEILMLVQLLASAGHIVLYDYNISTKSWTHKGVEGTLFLVKRRVPPSFQYIVLNKKSQGMLCTLQKSRCL